MKAPTEKTNDTIQIIVTTACNLFNCSNCTQLLPFRKDTRHMSPGVFREALRSLEGWPGVRGIFGGNPCSHPQFEELMTILVEEVPDQKQRGLWSNDFLGHGHLVRDVFYPRGRFNLNAHGIVNNAVKMDRWTPNRVIPTSVDRSSWHSPILLDWADLGIDELEWVDLREQCDINLTWSAAIAERDGVPFGYFCEVAAALDGIRGENHGVPCTPGWWRQGMDAFETQVERCCDRGCGIPLKRLGQLDLNFTYDYSRSFATIVEPHLKGKLRGQRHETMPTATTEWPTDYQGLRSLKP